MSRAPVLEDPLQFKVDAKEVEHAYTELVSGQGYYVLNGGFSTAYALAARDRLLELVKTEDSKATHFTGMH